MWSLLEARKVISRAYNLCFSLIILTQLHWKLWTKVPLWWLIQPTSTNLSLLWLRQPHWLIYCLWCTWIWTKESRWFQSCSTLIHFVTKWLILESSYQNHIDHLDFLNGNSRINLYQDSCQCKHIHSIFSSSQYLIKIHFDDLFTILFYEWIFIICIIVFSFEYPFEHFFDLR